MDEAPEIPLALACVIGIGIGAHWLAWQLRLPSILLLLLGGIVAGPILHVVEPEELLGELLFPFVSLCVGVILFEGGLSLKLSELRQIGRPLLLLLSIGVVVTWVLTAVAAHFLLALTWFASVQLGAILVVTGPTVIGPMLRQIRPIGQVGPIARWEGIMIDPIGAILAVLVFEVRSVFYLGETPDTFLGPLASGVATLAIGTTLGSATALLLATLLRKRLVPDYLDSPVTLMIVTVAFTASNLLQPESGLLTVTVMGAVLANTGVSLRHVIEFKENLSVLLIASLFVLLSARLEFASFLQLGWWGVAFLAVLILVVRPLSVVLALLWTHVGWKEQAFIAWLAPRGIVAAAVSSVFALRLGPEGASLVPATFLVIIGTVVVYGLTTPILARRLGLSSADPQGVLILGSNLLTRPLGLAIQDAGFPVLIVDTNRQSIGAARMEGLKTSNANILSEVALERLDLGGIGRYLGMTGNDEVNSLGGIHLAELFGRSNVFQLTPYREAEHKRDVAAAHLRLRFLFSDELTYRDLMLRIEVGDVVKATRITDEFTYDDFVQQYGDSAVPLFLCQRNRLTIITSDDPAEPQPGQTLIALVTPSTEAPPAARPRPAAESSERSA